jgi:hypothetical protein
LICDGLDQIDVDIGRTDDSAGKRRGNEAGEQTRGNRGKGSNTYIPLDNPPWAPCDLDLLSARQRGRRIHHNDVLLAHTGRCGNILQSSKDC